MNDFPYTETRFGFQWGPLTVQRLMSDPKAGVVIEVSTASQTLEIRATPKGLVLTAERLKRGPTPE